MEFEGQWTHHPKHGEQFKAIKAIQIKPATAAALENDLDILANDLPKYYTF